MTKRTQSPREFAIRDYWSILIPFTALPVTLLAVYFFNSDRGWDVGELLFVGSVIVLGCAFFVGLRAILESKRGFIPWAITASVLVSLMFGVAYAELSTEQRVEGPVTVAEMTDGSEVQIVRIGERFSLVLVGDRIAAEPTANIARIEQR